MYWLKQANKKNNLYAATTLAIVTYPNQSNYQLINTQLAKNANSFGYAQYVIGTNLVQQGNKTALQKGIHFLIKAYSNTNSPIIIRYKAAILLSITDSQNASMWQKNSNDLLKKYNCSKHYLSSINMLFIG